MRGGAQGSANNETSYGIRRLLRRTHLLRLSHRAEVLFLGEWGRLSGRFVINGPRGSRWRRLVKLASKCGAFGPVAAPQGRGGHLRSVPRSLPLAGPRVVMLPQSLIRPSSAKQLRLAALPYCPVTTPPDDSDRREPKTLTGLFEMLRVVEASLRGFAITSSGALGSQAPCTWNLALNYEHYMGPTEPRENPIRSLSAIPKWGQLPVRRPRVVWSRPANSPANSRKFIVYVFPIEVNDGYSGLGANLSLVSVAEALDGSGIASALCFPGKSVGARGLLS